MVVEPISPEVKVVRIEGTMSEWNTLIGSILLIVRVTDESAPPEVAGLARAQGTVESFVRSLQGAL